ncbi:MAG: discoidin domain-containing protein, partial [Mangrovimonas sp.]|nr:discoidin domain-containing protein [Mangrovimonas sp.]
LSYKKPVTTNSGLVTKEINVVDESDSGYMLGQIREFDINKINDEEIRSYWVSEANNDSIYVEMDLEKKMNVKAIQINFQDFNSDIYGRPDTLRQQFVLQSSIDKINWETIADYSKNTRDMPHGYIELEKPIDARYIRYNHVYCTNNYLSISELRVFGNGYEAKPIKPANFNVVRQVDRRNANLTWDADENAQGYVIYWGIAKDRLNLSALMYGKPNYELRALSTDQSYYMQVEAFNENGISEKSEIIFVE